MKKDEAITIISNEMECTKKSIDDLMADVDEIVTILATKLEVGDKVKIGNHIVLKKVEVAERSYRNPQNGEEIISPEHIEIKISATKSLKDSVK